MLLEIATHSLTSARRALANGANRLELCGELGVGGLTPSPGLVVAVLEESTIPVFALIRPRSGDFHFTADELVTMERDIRWCLDRGCAGVVIGALQRDRTIDTAATRRLMDAAAGKPVTFHRAFDWTPDPLQALDTLLNLEIPTLLTSGQQPGAEAGLDQLIAWQKRVGEDLTIMPGSGIGPESAPLFADAGFRAIHASAARADYEWSHPFPFSFNTPAMLDEQVRYETQGERVAAIAKAIIKAKT